MHSRPPCRSDGEHCPSGFRLGDNFAIVSAQIPASALDLWRIFFPEHGRNRWGWSGFVRSGTALLVRAGGIGIDFNLSIVFKINEIEVLWSVRKLASFFLAIHVQYDLL